ncbi:MAG: ribonuclease D [Janthinobacterium lividum]
MSFQICHHHHDLPDNVQFQTSVAIDTETMGLQLHRDRLCLVQLSQGDGICHVVQLNQDRLYQAPNLKKILTDPNITKIFHFARFDVAALYQYLNVLTYPIYCTKIASKLVRTFTDRHGLRDLCKELLSIDISKEQQMSDWGHGDLKSEQLKYAATDVLHLHKLKEILDQRLEREDRATIARACFEFIPTCAKLDLMTQNPLDVFEH